MYFVHKDGWKRKKQSLKKVSPLFGIFTFLTFTTSHANLVDGMRPGILAPAFFDGAPRTTRPREIPSEGIGAAEDVHVYSEYA